MADFDNRLDREDGIRTMDERYEYFLIDRNGLWKEHVESVKNNGAANVSPLSRLIYACEVGDGIDQHASEDLKAVSAELAALREMAEKAGGKLNKIAEAIRITLDDGTAPDNIVDCVQFLMIQEYDPMVMRIHRLEKELASLKGDA